MKNNKKWYLIIFILLIFMVILFFCYKEIAKENNFIGLNYDEFMDKINNKDSFVLCISATNCSHCQIYKPKLKDVSNDYNIKIYYVDVDTFNDDDYEEFKSMFSFEGTPTTIFIKDGEEKTTANRIEEDVSKEKIINKLKATGFID